MDLNDTDSFQQPMIESVLSPRFIRRSLIGIFLTIFVLSILIGVHINRSHKINQQLIGKLLVQGYAQRLQERLQTAMVSSYILAAAVKQAEGVPLNFQDLAADLLVHFPSVSAMQLAPDGVIREIYPLEGNEAALGHDLLSDRRRNREAVTAISKQQLTLAGPFNLIQGGVGAVGRLPIFLINQRNESYFWGFVNVLVKVPQMLELASFDELHKEGFVYELWRIDPDTDQRHVFSRTSKTELVAPVEHVITVHNGRWILSVAPIDGWASQFYELELLGYAVAIALLVTLMAHLGLRSFSGVRT